jgi:hypothetical protein
MRDEAYEPLTSRAARPRGLEARPEVLSCLANWSDYLRRLSMKRYAFVFSVLVLALTSSVADAHQEPFDGTLAAVLGVPQNGTTPVRLSGTLTTLGQVTGGGRFNLNGTSMSNGFVALTDKNGHKVLVTFNATVAANNSFSGTFSIVGGTGKWLGHFGGGTVTGDLDNPASFTFDGVIQE